MIETGAEPAAKPEFRSLIGKTPGPELLILAIMCPYEIHLSGISRLRLRYLLTTKQIYFSTSTNSSLPTYNNLHLNVNPDK